MTFFFPISCSVGYALLRHHFCLLENQANRLKCYVLLAAAVLQVGRKTMGKHKATDIESGLFSQSGYDH